MSWPAHSKPLRLCFDLDETLCTGAVAAPGQPTCYDACKVIPGRVEHLRALREQGHEVIIFTARGMGSNAGDRAAAEAQVLGQTLMQLAAWGIEYDEIYFGKPAADVYIDDKAKAVEHWPFGGD